MKTDERTLRVIGKTFTAGAIFRKNETGRWEIWSIAPYLAKIIGRTPIEKVGEVLKAKGLSYEWLDRE